MSVLLNSEINISEAAINNERLNEVEMAPAELSSAEIAQRVAILRRFKILLTQQRDRFRSYLQVLDKQQDTIESGSAEDLLTYVELEEQIVADIFSIQKVIDPLDDMYRAVVSVNNPSGPESDDEVPDLKATLESLKNEAVIRSTKNKELLSRRIVELRSEITALRNNPYAASSRRSAFSDGKAASLIDIQG